MTNKFGGYWIAYHARATPQKTALANVADSRRISYAELDERVGRAAGALRDSFGVGRGDRVAMLSRNCARAFELMYACARLGAIFVPLNVRLSDAELTGLAADAGPTVVVGEGELVDRGITPAVPALSWEDGYEQALAGSHAAEPVPLDPADPWVIIYTSGTTGLPKGVVVTHAGSDATMLAALVAGRVSGSSACLTALPVWHVAGLNLFANPVLFAGGTVLVMQSFDPAAALELLTREEDPVTHFCGVPAHYQFMQALPGFAGARTQLLRRCRRVTRPRGACAVLGRARGDAADHLRHHRSRRRGDDESAGNGGHHAGDVGLPLWHLRCRVMSGDRPCGPGEPGELQIAGTSVTPGYWRQQRATAQAIEDGWLHTGDIAVTGPDGHIRIVDRIKDMYISGGENVYPAEVEEALYHHPAVAEVAVVGVPDQRWGETGAAWIVLAPGARETPSSIRAWARTRIAAFKVPRDINLTGELPHNATGKVLKAELRRKTADSDETAQS